METQILQSIYNKLNDISLNTVPEPKAYKTDLCSILQFCFNEGFLAFYSFGPERLASSENCLSMNPVVFWVMSSPETGGVVSGIYNGTFDDVTISFIKQATGYTKQASNNLMMYVIINIAVNLLRVARTFAQLSAMHITGQVSTSIGLSSRYFIGILNKKGKKIVIEPRHFDTAYTIDGVTKIFSSFNMPKDLLRALDVTT